MDLSVVRYLHKWVYSRNTNLFSVFNQFKPLSSLCFFHFFLVLSGWCVGMENSFTAAKHIQRKASPAPMKANCKDFTSVNLPETLRTWPVTDMFIHAWASCLYHKAPEASSFHPAHSSCFYRC